MNTVIKKMEVGPICVVMICNDKGKYYVTWHNKNKNALTMINSVNIVHKDKLDRNRYGYFNIIRGEGRPQLTKFQAEKRYRELIVAAQTMKFEKTKI